MSALVRMEAFRSVLKDYNLSESGRKVLDQTQLVLLVGVTASGRNTIISELLNTGEYHHIVSDTTREVRVKNGKPIEKNGREYWFRDESEVLTDLQNGKFVEAAIIHGQQVSGISIREIEKARQDNHIAITDIDPAGADTIHSLKPDVTTVFIALPSFEEWMHRLHARSDLPEDEIHRRIEAGYKEIAIVLEHNYYTFVLNDRLDMAMDDVRAIARGTYNDAAKQVTVRNVVEKLYQDTQKYLRTN